MGGKNSLSQRTDHAPCVHGRRLTAAQVRVYEALSHASEPRSAYQLLNSLNGERDTHFYPQTVYRALACLQKAGLVHRVESSNAYMPCRAPSRPHRSIHLLCDRCGAAQELIDAHMSETLEAGAAQRHFHVQRQIIELHGLCAACARVEAHS